MMKAALFHEYGGTEVIQVGRVPVPVAGPGEVLVQIAATSFNPSDTALRAGALREVLPLTFPHIPGWDVSGIVVAVGDGVTRWSAGDRVMGRVDSGGAAAEFATVPASLLVEAPASAVRVGSGGRASAVRDASGPEPADEALALAAAIPVAGLTAWQTVYEHTNVSAGQRVLINGAGGGVGGFAVQLAKLAGATVIATASPRSTATVAELGADEVIDYTNSPLPSGMDVVINLAPVSPETAAGLATLLRPGGTAVSIATPIPGHPTFTARNTPTQIAELGALVAKGELRLDVTEAVALEELAQVHRRSEAGQTRGKIIVLP
ncbi:MULTISPECIES: NADP-dependent oxidoreductase [Streptosporangium]|uniref:NADPH:quinone reductase-like Zn-dependent oxidoreductase n=1 Tax=Streptosporangium brasiliense TaxID=47480 RepID=A0ABT9RGM7_9ACTN|nr:NADP-dependent oxidoreductase [Streptosporangium brasiliense]MDP9868436.1 NADPH:quinone reductase-like Zn-dependent oxidoreductase [Streptosporangium brasiliense]